MKPNIKHRIVVVLIAMLVAGCGRSLPEKNAPADVSKAAARIAEFTVPEGYQPEFTVSMAGFTIVSYNPGDDHSHLYLVQAPPDYQEDQAKLEEALRQAQSGTKDDSTRMTVVEKRQVSIRGQQTTLIISEGVNSSDQPYRQATATFQGKNGPALLVISEPTARWDTAHIDQLIASIK